MKEHHYKADIVWTGNKGDGTLNYRSYSRDHIISIENKQIKIPSSSDPSFLGNTTRYNPEELLVASISSCHMLWFLHLCSAHKIVVVDYIDNATGVMEESDDGSGRFREVVLHPQVTIIESDKMSMIDSLHKKANKMCFIANSVNFSVIHKPTIQIQK